VSLSARVDRLSRTLDGMSSRRPSVSELRLELEELCGAVELDQNHALACACRRGLALFEGETRPGAPSADLISWLEELVNFARAVCRNEELLAALPQRSRAARFSHR